jgi:hypothetical protein
LIEVARQRKAQAPPPHVVFEALTQPHRAQGRGWLRLAPGEIEPAVLEAAESQRVVWSTLWPEHPSARIEFELRPDRAGTHLSWVLQVVDDAVPDDAAVAVLRHRLNELINRDLRMIAFDY